MAQAAENESISEENFIDYGKNIKCSKHVFTRAESFAFFVHTEIVHASRSWSKKHNNMPQIVNIFCFYSLLEKKTAVIDKVMDPSNFQG